MKKARILLASLCVLAGIGGALAFKARDAVYFYQTTTAGGAITYRTTLVTFDCTSTVVPCTTLINNAVKTLYTTQGTSYITVSKES